MKINMILFLLLTSVIMSSCTATGYYITGNEIKYVHYDYGGTIKKHETPIDADPKTFKPIPKWESIYGKDESSVFNGSLKIKNADPKTFTPLNEHFSKDSKRVFYGSKCEINGADNKTFTPINSYMAKDKFRVYKYIFKNDYSCKTALNIIPSTDTASFQLLNRFYSKDKNAVFFENNPIKEAKPTTFRAFDEWHSIGFGIDDKHVYYEGKLIEQADPSSFLVIDSTFSKDKTYVYVHKFHKIKAIKNVNIDVTTYKMMRGSCKKCPSDKNYCHEHIDGIILCLTVKE